jgi:hypothetical protein
MSSHPTPGFTSRNKISPMLLRLTAAAAATTATAICQPAIPSLAWHGVAAQGGQGLAQKSVSLLALLSGSSRPVFDAAQGDGDRGRGGDWPSSGTHASLDVLLLHALHSQGHALNVPKVPMTTRPKETTIPSQILSGNHLFDPVIVVSSQDPWFLTIAALCSRPPTEKPQDPLQNRPDLFSP